MTIRSLLPSFFGIFSLALLASCATERETNLFRGPFSKSREIEGSALIEEPRGASPYGRSQEEALRRAAAAGVQPGSPEDLELRARAEAMTAKQRKREAKRLAKLAAARAEASGEMAPTAAAIAPAAHPGLGAYPQEPRRGGWFSGWGAGRSRKTQGDHEIYVDQAQLADLTPSNSRIEIDLGDQRVRVFRTSGGLKTLVIDSEISTGKAGYETPTGSYTITEMQVEKQSTLYGIWYDASGAVVPSSGDSSPRPSGATTFVGADMPYWMRITGGVGMHIGEVPGYPASHGCIRVPASVQPLIYSKARLGAPVTITY